MTSGYRLAVEPIPGETTAHRDGAVIARTNAARLMRETRLNPSVYFPRDALTVPLARSDLRTFCPFKGTAHYWHADIGGERVENAVWSYERALPESAGVEGMFGLTPGLTTDIRIASGAPAPSDDGHVAGPLVDWIMREGAFCTDGADLTRNLGERFVEHGVAVFRLSVFLWSLHPQIAGVRYLWNRGEAEVEIGQASYDTLKHPAFANSPLTYVSNGLGGVRQMLDAEEMEFDFPIFTDLREVGATDYVAMPLFFSDGSVNVMTMASDHPRGFTTENLGLVFECSSAISRYYEVQTLRANTVALLDTYVGQRAGGRVLDGEIRRGDGDDIEAAILFCDLVGSTKWAEQLSREDYLALLNGFFETVSAEVEANGGEILKFIGDAVLAVFPAESDPAAACERAAAATRSIPEAVAAIQPDDPLACALGVSFGPVTYGNVGAPGRLDFTVIGQSATIAARLSDLAKTQGASALITEDIARAAEGETSLGPFELHNIAAPVEVFSI